MANLQQALTLGTQTDKAPVYDSDESAKFFRTYKVYNHLESYPTTESSTIDPLHRSNDSLVVTWMYLTISSKLVEMVVDVDTSAHDVWKRFKDLFHNNKDARVTQHDNELRNMSIGSSSITYFFQDIKSKAGLANLDSLVKDTSLVTYSINGIRSKYPNVARVIRIREKAPTFDELRSMMLLEESDMSHQSARHSLLHNTSSSHTVLVSSTTPHDKANTMATSGFDVCRNFQRVSCSYEAWCKLVHSANDLRSRLFPTNSTTQGRGQPPFVNRTQQTNTKVASKATLPTFKSTTGQACVA
uniref:WRKY family transcription factor n=1 Tax=Tanacetum cinerariifolium TaxID=118510 RepID=A0A699K6G0_TANCI|nr:WRKY family transcription factor [Tanacetum cinerariifolium]